MFSIKYFIYLISFFFHLIQSLGIPNMLDFTPGVPEISTFVPFSNFKPIKLSKPFVPLSKTSSVSLRSDIALKPVPELSKKVVPKQALDFRSVSNFEAPALRGTPKLLLAKAASERLSITLDKTETLPELVEMIPKDAYNLAGVKLHASQELKQVLNFLERAPRNTYNRAPSFSNNFLKAVDGNSELPRDQQSVMAYP